MIEFNDYVWVGSETYLTKLPFYAIYEEQGFPGDIDGILGVTTMASEEPSLVRSLVREGVIQSAVVGV